MPVSIGPGAIWLAKSPKSWWTRSAVRFRWNFMKFEVPHIYILSWILRLRRKIPLHSGTTDTRSIGNPGSRIRGAGASRRRNNYLKSQNSTEKIFREKISTHIGKISKCLVHFKELAKRFVQIFQAKCQQIFFAKHFLEDYFHFLDNYFLKVL